MSGWRIRREERDGRLVAVLSYESTETDYATQEEYDQDREIAEERRN
jgi:hypothetical protein